MTAGTVGIVYLVQPKELIGTSRYKVGCSESATLTRVQRGYRAGTRYLFIMECDKPRELERILITTFEKNFERIAGNEYFQGDEQTMRLCFMKICMTEVAGASVDADADTKLHDRALALADPVTENLERLDPSRMFYTVRLADGRQVQVVKSPRDHWVLAPRGQQSQHTRSVSTSRMCTVRTIGKIAYHDFMVRIRQAPGDDYPYSCKILDLRSPMSFHDPDMRYPGEILLDRSTVALDTMEATESLSGEAGDKVVGGEAEVSEAEVGALPEILSQLSGRYQNELRRFLYYVLVEEPEQTNVLKLTRESAWIISVLTKLKLDLCGVNSSHFNSLVAKPPMNRNEHVKQIRTGTVRFLVIFAESLHDAALQREILFYSGLGVKNFVVADSDHLLDFADPIFTRWRLQGMLSWVSAWSAA